MARQKAPHGTYSAYRRHLRDGSEPCEACLKARKAYNKDHSSSQSRASVSEVAPVTHPEALRSSFFDAQLELEKTLTMIDQAVEKGLKEDPSKLGTLLKTRAEVVDRLAGMHPTQEKEVDPFDALISESRDPVRSATAPDREAA